MTSLDRIQVKGFKSIREMDLELRELNVLIGANGAGKSNFISIFHMLNQLIEERLQTYVIKSGGADRLLYFGRKNTEELSINLEFGQNGYEATLAATDDNSLFFSAEHCWFHDENYPRSYNVFLGSAHRETQIHEEARQQHGRIARYVIESMKSWKVYHFHDTSSSAQVKASAKITDNATLRSDASNLAAYLYFLREKHIENYNQIVRVIRLAAPFFDNFTLRPEQLDPSRIKLEWREQASDHYFDATSLSDGTLRFMSLATLLLQPQLPTTILIDEPELGLHPYAITLLGGMLKSVATKAQVLLSTQSVELVNQFLPENIIVVERKNGESTFRSLSQED